MIYFYEQSNNSPFKGVILNVGLTKDEEIADPPKLWKLITDSVEKEKTLRLLFAWEAVIDKAQDKAFGQSISKDIQCTVSNLIRSLCKDFGEESAARELVNTIMQLVSRRMYEPEEFKSLDALIKEINTKNVEPIPNYPCKEDISLYNKLMFYQPNNDEPVWTGDIFKTQGLAKYDQYAIVLTPVVILRMTKPQGYCYVSDFQSSKKH